MAHTRIRSLGSLALAGALVGTLGACSENNGDGRVNLQVATSAATPTAALAGFEVAVNLGDDALVIDKVELVARKIELGGSDDACLDPVGEDATEGDESGEAGECNEARLAPTLIDLPLDPGVQPFTLSSVPAGSYDRIRFQIHRPTDQNLDDDFLAEHPDFANTSIRVQGSFNGAPFTYTSDLTVVQEVQLEQDLEVVEGGTADLTLLVDVSGWFLSADGSALIDPATAADGQPNESLVEQNIKTSFRAFPDEDGDATED